MKKYKVTHDSTLLSFPTLPTNDCNQITDSGMGVGAGQILYGIIVQRKRQGIGMQNFLLISSPDYISGKVVIGQYVPISAVKEVRENPIDPISNSASRGANTDVSSSSPIIVDEKNYTASNIIIGVGLVTGTILSFTPYKKYTLVGLAIITIGFVMSLYKQSSK